MTMAKWRVVISTFNILYPKLVEKQTLVEPPRKYHHDNTSYYSIMPSYTVEIAAESG
jgi:hypothetical protein